VSGAAPACRRLLLPLLPNAVLRVHAWRRRVKVSSVADAGNPVATFAGMRAAVAVAVLRLCIETLVLRLLFMRAGHSAAVTGVSCSTVNNNLVASSGQVSSVRRGCIAVRIFHHVTHDA
jgi:hypothetical protein